MQYVSSVPPSLLILSILDEYCPLLNADSSKSPSFLPSFLSSVPLNLGSKTCSCWVSFSICNLVFGESSRPLWARSTCRTCSRSRRLSAVKSGEDAEESPSGVTLHVMCLQPETGLVSSAHLYGTHQGQPGNKACLSIYGCTYLSVHGESVCETLSE